MCHRHAHVSTSLSNHAHIITMADRLHKLLQEEETVSHERVLSLLADGADPCWTAGDGNSALSLSVQREEPPLLQLLLSRCTDDKQAPAKSAALAMAVISGSLDCVRLLLQPGLGDPGLINSMIGAGENTPLLVAVSEVHREVARFLLESGADPNLSDCKGRTAVHLAAVRGSVELLQDLKQFGADMCPLDDNGNLPIHFCIHPDVIEFLHSEGNKASTRNKQGSTPLETIVRISPDLPAVAVLRHLVEQDSSGGSSSSRQTELRGRRPFWHQLGADVARSIGWKWMVFIIMVICFFSWQITVYLHGQSPLHMY